jgi:class 3 adenylate cyclase
MAHYVHFPDPNSPDIKEYLAGIPTCPGTCFFIDINKSTDLKYSGGLPDWGRRLNNTFNFISVLNDFPDNIVKGIGDEIMLYIPDEKLQQKRSISTCYQLLEEIYSTVYNIMHFPEPDMFLPCKVSIHYCTEVYNITFFKGANDYYGRDIDLTARLMSKSKANRIVVSEAFYRKALEDLERMNLPASSGCLEHISGRQTERFRGVPVETEYRVIDVGERKMKNEE